MLKRLGLLWTLARGDAVRLWRALRHPDSPAWLKVGAAALVLYLLLPVDLLPDFVALFGLADDVALIVLAVRYMLSRLPPQVRADIARGPAH
jgi:uncharacterized membrane protein YkvA (DUF1232 family)